MQTVEQREAILKGREELCDSSERELKMLAKRLQQLETTLKIQSDAQAEKELTILKMQRELSERMREHEKHAAALQTREKMLADSERAIARAVLPSTPAVNVMETSSARDEESAGESVPLNHSGGPEITAAAPPAEEASTSHQQVDSSVRACD